MKAGVPLVVCRLDQIGVLRQCHRCIVVASGDQRQQKRYLNLGAGLADRGRVAVGRERLDDQLKFLRGCREFVLGTITRADENDRCIDIFTEVDEPATSMILYT